MAEDRDRRKLDEAEDQKERLERELRDLSSQVTTVLNRLKREDHVGWAKDIAMADRLSLLLANLRKERNANRRKTEGLRRRIQHRLPDLEQARNELNELEQRLERTLREQSRLRLLIDGCYSRLDTRQKAFLDAVKITASTMFRLLLGAFRPIYGNYRNDVALLRKLTRADGFIVLDNGIARIGLWLKGTYQPVQIKAFRTFLRGMNRAISTQFSGRRIPICVSLVDSPDDLLRPTKN